MDEKYCRFGKENQCPHLEKCHSRGEVFQHAYVGFNEAPPSYLMEGKETITWENSAKLKVHCIDRILS